MARGEKRMPFTFELGGCVTLECIAIIRFGEVMSVRAYFGDKLFDPDGIVIDWQDEFLPMAESLMRYAKQFYLEQKEEEGAWP